MNELSLKTQMSIQKWLDIIHRCRESGLSNRQWCQENGIQLKSYYYWLSKIR
ncbi:IS66 family insertion sequence element accessory protein TnpA, partial [Blautia producta]